MHIHSSSGMKYLMEVSLWAAFSSHIFFYFKSEGLTLQKNISKNFAESSLLKQLFFLITVSFHATEESFCRLFERAICISHIYAIVKYTTVHRYTLLAHIYRHALPSLVTQAFNIKYQTSKSLKTFSINLSPQESYVVQELLICEGSALKFWCRTLLNYTQSLITAVISGSSVSLRNLLKKKKKQ